MNKTMTIILIVIATVVMFFLGFEQIQTLEPKTYYNVYLESELLGVIESKSELENYIDELGDEIKETFLVDAVYAPNGLEIKRIDTYSNNVMSIDEIYDEIKERQPFTIRGYTLTLKGEEDRIIHVTEEEIIEEAILDTIKTFTGTDHYEAYINETQIEIVTTGEVIDNIYIAEEMTIKEENISADATIYTSSEELAKYLLFGTTVQQDSYIVKYGDTIEQVAFDNQINVEEFLISNPQFTNENNLLFPGQVVVIGKLDPKISVVVEETQVKDNVINYKTIEQVDPDLLVGNSKVLQEGQDGVVRITQKVEKTNGNITYVDPIEELEELLVPSVDKIVQVGGKYVPNVATGTWTWPTNSGYTITSGYGYRVNPFGGGREFHNALDIATGYGSPIYAANNGTIYRAEYHYSYGYYVIINHNNGIYTLYAHMASIYTKTVGMTVEAGTQIGTMGMTGSATGPHLHFEVWEGKVWSGTHFNPYTLY